jgi:ubiquinone/menaquinone biosynthesis C-methylase UbiE
MSATEQYLQDFHARRPGATRRAFENQPCRSATREYASSYDVLAALVPHNADASTVLDLACGDGPLLERLAARDRASPRLVGVDFSRGELAAARAVLPVEVALLRARAQQLPIGDGAADYVLSHMALMLMDDLDTVMAEIRRVLKPGGLFATVVGRSFLTGAVGDALLDVFMPIAREALPPMNFGDARTSTAEGWAACIGSGFDAPRCEDLDVAWTPTPQELWDSMLETYDADRLPEAAQETFRVRLLAALAPLCDARGRLDTAWGLRVVQARAC